MRSSPSTRTRTPGAGADGTRDLARLDGHLDEARQRYEKALEILREVSAKPEIARCQAGLGRIAMSQGDLQLARPYLGASLELSQSSGSRIGMIRIAAARSNIMSKLGVNSRTTT